MAQDDSSGTPAQKGRGYLLPEPERELQRLTDQHESIRYAMNGQLILAPLDFSKPGLRVLDSATADGLFLREIAPQLTAPAELHGTDITTSFFRPGPSSPFHFSEQNINDPWPANLHDHYDFVHQRFALAGCGRSSPKEAIQKLTTPVAPGGWIQLAELDAYNPLGGPALQNSFEVMRGVFDKAGTGADFAPKLSGWLKEWGFEDVQERVVQVPLGKKCGDPGIGERAARTNVQTAQALVGAAKALNVNVAPSVIDGLSERLEKEFAEQGGVYQIIFTWGRKPKSS